MLTARKRAFVDYYISAECAGNASKAAVLAGYSPRCVNRTASRLLKDVDIVSHIRAFEDARKERYSKENYIDTAWKEYESLGEAPSKIRALELVGKALGYLGVGMNDSRPNQLLNITNINLAGCETQEKLWAMTRRLLGAE